MFEIIMAKLSIPTCLEDKIFEIRFEPDNTLSKIVSYFPLAESEKQEILSIIGDKSFDGFYSVFIDTVTDEEWNKTKEQIKKKFNNELFDVDKT